MNCGPIPEFFAAGPLEDHWATLEEVRISDDEHGYFKCCILSNAEGYLPNDHFLVKLTPQRMAPYAAAVLFSIAMVMSTVLTQTRASIVDQNSLASEALNEILNRAAPIAGKSHTFET